MNLEPSVIGFGLKSEAHRKDGRRLKKNFKFDKKLSILE